MKRRDFVVTALLTFCLTALLFMVIPTKSQETGEYDPWSDINGDGKIDILDVVSMTRIYATSGDPTRNMNITNFPLDEYGNLRVSEQKTLQTYKDVVEIAVFDKDTRITNAYEVGVLGYNFHVYFPFAPKTNFLNVTALEFTMTCAQDDNSNWKNINYNISFNEIQIAQDYVQQPPGNVLAYKTRLYSDSNVTSLIKPGINSIKLDFGSELVQMWRITVLIEYQYKA